MLHVIEKKNVQSYLEIILTYHFSQTCIRKPLLEPLKSDCLGQEVAL